ncbi:hypothetical protein M422DRAFT_54788 [Sphaerobolus stellatus SS14]|uniref:Uncharacterized protein n=1 Tax=Sphaerobolus stellatus (strain SS14) TaxID=990650 RepID=A0A0C9URR1_SPHS4|nr:hypothetical protein M422DRAFT_54788 [Sphaerobolus stellatus SS14]
MDRYWTNILQRQFLLPLLIHYQQLKAPDPHANVEEFLERTEEAWFKRFPERLALFGMKDNDSWKAVDEKPTVDEAERYPDTKIDDLSIAQHKELKQAIKVRSIQLEGWFKNHRNDNPDQFAAKCEQDLTKQKKQRGKENACARKSRKSSGMQGGLAMVAEAIPIKRIVAPRHIDIYMTMFPRCWNSQYEEVWAVKKASGETVYAIQVIREVCADCWQNEKDLEVIAAVNQAVKEGQQEADRMRQDIKAAKQKETGGYFMLIWGGPLPEHGGELKTLIGCGGAKVNGMNFREWKADFKSTISADFASYLREIYSENVQNARRLEMDGVSQNPVSPPGAVGNEGASAIHSPTIIDTTSIVHPPTIVPTIVHAATAIDGNIPTGGCHSSPTEPVTPSHRVDKVQPSLDTGGEAREGGGSEDAMEVEDAQPSDGTNTGIASLNGSPTRTIVKSWVSMEAMMGFPESIGKDRKHRLPAGSRPMFMTKWIGKGRPMGDLAGLAGNYDAKELGSEWESWWMDIQPQWLHEGTEQPTKDPWINIRKGGVNGIANLLVLLWWWRSKAKGNELRRWKRKVSDVTDVLTKATKEQDTTASMNNTSQKRKRGAPETSSKDMEENVPKRLRAHMKHGKNSAQYTLGWNDIDHDRTGWSAFWVMFSQVDRTLCSYIIDAQFALERH